MVNRYTRPRCCGLYIMYLFFLTIIIVRYNTPFFFSLTLKYWKVQSLSDRGYIRERKKKRGGEGTGSVQGTRKSAASLEEERREEQAYRKL